LLHAIRKKRDTCCLGHVDTLQAVREAVVPSASPTVQPTHDDSVITKITAIVEARAIRDILGTNFVKNSEKEDTISTQVRKINEDSDQIARDTGDSARN
jgi:hypothetical protein